MEQLNDVCPFGFGVGRFVPQNILENIEEVDEGFCYNGIDLTVSFGMTEFQLE